MASGWAFVDCTESGGGQAAGPTGSVQFLTGANATSGSTNLVYHTASAGGLPVSTLVLSGTLIVTGNISASSFTVKSVQEIDGTGSTFFGDTNDDIHVRTGSLSLMGGGGEVYFLARPGGGGLPRRVQIQSASVRMHYSAALAHTTSVATTCTIVGVRRTGEARLVLPNANSWGSKGGALMTIKDEVVYRTGSITIVPTGCTIDGESSYELSGTMPAINLYSNGTNWFVY